MRFSERNTYHDNCLTETCALRCVVENAGKKTGKVREENAGVQCGNVGIMREENAGTKNK